MLIFHLVTTCLLSLCAYLWNDWYSVESVYLRADDPQYQPSQIGVNLMISTFFTTLCLNSTFIPISLLVAVEMVKVAQAYFLTVDKEMFTSNEDGSIQPCQVNTASLNEELG